MRAEPNPAHILHTSYKTHFSQISHTKVSLPNFEPNKGGAKTVSVYLLQLSERHVEPGIPER